MLKNKRAVSPYDLDILNTLKEYWGDRVKISSDITGNPCLFIKYKGPWDVLYVLSIDGVYDNNKLHYVTAAHKAALVYCSKKDAEKINAEKEKQYAEDFQKLQKRIETIGYKDDLPE